MDLINSLPDRILLYLMLKVPGSTFIHLPDVCKNFNRIFSLLMKDNQMLKKKYEYDEESRNLIKPFSNRYIEKKDDYWIEMFKMGSNGVKELGKELIIRNKNDEQKLQYKIFDNQVYWYHFDIIKIADIQSPLQYTIEKTLLPNSVSGISMHIMAPIVGNRFIPNPHIFRHYSSREYQILIYDKKANSIDLLTTLKVPFYLNYKSIKICDNFILVQGCNNIGVYKIFGVSPNKSEIEFVALLKYDAELIWKRRVEFYRDGFLVLYDDVLEYYSLQNEVSKIFTKVLKLSMWKEDNETSFEVMCVRGKVFIYFDVFDKIYLLEHIETNPTLVVIAENFQDKNQFYIFIEKRIEFGIIIHFKDPECSELEFKQKGITSSIEELKLAPHKFSHYNYYCIYYKPDFRLGLNESSMILENVLSFSFTED